MLYSGQLLGLGLNTRLEELEDQLAEGVVLRVAGLDEDVAAPDVDDAAGAQHARVQVRIFCVRRLLRLPGGGIRPEPTPDASNNPASADVRRRRRARWRRAVSRERHASDAKLCLPVWLIEGMAAVQPHKPWSMLEPSQPVYVARPALACQESGLQ